MKRGIIFVGNDYYHVAWIVLYQSYKSQSFLVYVNLNCLNSTCDLEITEKLILPLTYHKQYAHEICLEVSVAHYKAEVRRTKLKIIGKHFIFGKDVFEERNWNSNNLTNKVLSP